MPLIDTGLRTPVMEGKMSARAKDSLGNVVVISAGTEVIEDHGWASIFDIASQKYNAGKVEPNSNPPLVRVGIGDFNA